MAKIEGEVVPTPAVPKTLGILNVIFGILFMLMGTCVFTSVLVGPSFVRVIQQMVQKQQAVAEEKHRALIRTLEGQEKAAQTEPEKKTIRDRRAVLIAHPPKSPAIDVGDSLEAIKDPTVKGFALGQAGTGMVMNILLIASGIGLIRLRRWGRSLALWLSGAQIVRLGLLTAISLLVVAPAQKPINDRLVAKLEAQVKDPNAPAAVAGTLEMTKLMASLAPAFTIGYVVGGSIYPVILLILLNSAGARAACPPRVLEGPTFS